MAWKQRFADASSTHRGERQGEFAARVSGFRLTGCCNDMQKPNYQFEKRRKEMDKKAKKEAKRLQKLEASRSPAAENVPTPSAPVEPA